MSSRFSWQPQYSKVRAVEVMEMPRCFSSSIQSDVAEREDLKQGMEKGRAGEGEGGEGRRKRMRGRERMRGRSGVVGWGWGKEGGLVSRLLGREL